MGRWILVVSLCFLCLASLEPGHASDDVGSDTGHVEDQRVRTEIDHDTGKRLKGAMTALEEERYEDARGILSHLNPTRLNEFEQSRVEQLRANIDQAQGRYADAREHLKNAVASGGLNEEEASTARMQIAQFSLAQQNWTQAVEDLRNWFAHAETPSAQAYYLLGAAYYQQQRYDLALEPTSKAVEISDTPQENWLQLLLALRIMREEYEEAVPVLMRLVAGHPERKNYWTQLTSVYSALGQYENATATMQLAYDNGLLTDDAEIRRLAELLIHTGIPRRAADLLELAIAKQNRFRDDPKAHELLGNCWIAAREYKKAIAPLARAAELATSGDSFVRLAEVQIQLEEWAKASESLQDGLRKGGLERPGRAQLLLGIALYNRKNLQAARTWLEQARAEEDTRSQAEAWLKQIEVDSGISSS
jgi:tetratricopeptide (TPR) repeat protein